MDDNLAPVKPFVFIFEKYDNGLLIVRTKLNVSKGYLVDVYSNNICFPEFHGACFEVGSATISELIKIIEDFHPDVLKIAVYYRDDDAWNSYVERTVVYCYLNGEWIKWLDNKNDWE